MSQLFYTLAGIARICDKLDLESAKPIVQALLLSKLDYCYSPLASSAQYQLDKLQHIENIACRVVCQLMRFDHVTNSMESLHWLKVWEYIVFKLAYKSTNANQIWLQHIVRTCYMDIIAHPEHYGHPTQTA